jgi:pimeloyl-ACP methyl ester carboxylesterase
LITAELEILQLVIAILNSSICRRYCWFIRFAENTKADILGYSMASFIAQQLTLLHPEKVNRLVLYGASCGGKEGFCLFY